MGDTALMYGGSLLATYSRHSVLAPYEIPVIGPERKSKNSLFMGISFFSVFKPLKTLTKIPDTIKGVGNLLFVF